jgi:hypothetical protein
MSYNPGEGTPIAYHRGFPAVIGCTARHWHTYHRRFPGPVESLHLIGFGQGEWGTFSRREDDGVRLVRSMLAPGLVVAQRGSINDVYLTAFPNVRRVTGDKCSAAFLTAFTTDRCRLPGST